MRNLLLIAVLLFAIPVKADNSIVRVSHSKPIQALFISKDDQQLVTINSSNWSILPSSQTYYEDFTADEFTTRVYYPETIANINFGLYHNLPENFHGDVHLLIKDKPPIIITNVFMRMRNNIGISTSFDTYFTRDGKRYGFDMHTYETQKQESGP